MSTRNRARDQNLEDTLKSSPDGLKWRRSKWRNAGNCVEAAGFGEVIKVRSSAEPGGVTLAVDLEVWRDFISRLRAERFDVP